MLSVGEDVEADALFKRGWTVSAIARHLGRDRKTVRSYLSGERTPGVRRPANPDPLDEYRAYVAARFVDDPHLWASALFDEVVALGYRSSYVSFARQVRLAGLRPHCEACTGVKGRETIEIDHPPARRSSGTGSSGAMPRGAATAYVLLGHAVALGTHPRGAVRIDGPGSSDRVHGRRDATPRRHRRAVAHGPPGDGDRARHAPMCRTASPRWPSTMAPSSRRVLPDGETEKVRSSAA